MGVQQKNLSIAFREIQPEMLFQSMYHPWSTSGPNISAAAIDSEIFQGLAHTQYPARSYEEIESIHQLLQENMQPISRYVTSRPSVFHLLVRMGLRVFRECGDGLTCDFSQMLAWQNVYQKLGQDLFTTAFLAHEDLRRGHPCRAEFAWDAIIKTDNDQINTMLRRGVAENHCHLGGTTQNFPLSWACIMNYPHTIRLAAAQIKQNLQPSYSRGSAGNVWPWERRLQWAAYLRIELFKCIENCCASDKEVRFNMDLCFYPLLHIKRELHCLKSCYAARVPQKDGSTFVLDYALRETDCRNGLLKNHNRLLSGERSFLYRCFRACFDGTFSEETQNWFYLYLLIKENFRAELIQVNRQAGFKNFKDYQDRKDGVYDAIDGYCAEAIRLSINANQKRQNIISFEARIAPKTSAEAMRRQIKNYEEQVKYAGRAAKRCHHFYVYHFIKNPDSTEKFQDQPRNKTTRNTSRRCAKAIRYALQHSPMFCKCVRGIDAANIEIGCRPETFATEFRFLKDTRQIPRAAEFLDLSTCPHIHATYHAGEDFLDIVDGLRTIDEAVKFLCLERGDRLGHALALGIEPARHYSFKGYRVVLPKQELLDNIVWLLYRSQELGVQIVPRLRSQLQTIAERYFSEIYGNVLQNSHLIAGLYEYYCSMQLRGDAPELYQVLPYREPKYFLYGTYDCYKENPDEELKSYRNSIAITALCQFYHYNKASREVGCKVAEFATSEDYFELVRNVQDGLARDLMKKGIMIECNPTSNYLIGTFRRYDAHPIFRFNNVGLIRTDGVFEPCAHLSVSINTDDLGVFDTSLENEYAILAAGLERMMLKGAPKYSRDSIYDYLDRVRKMGLEQSFLPLYGENSWSHSRKGYT